MKRHFEMKTVLVLLMPLALAAQVAQKPVTQSPDNPILDPARLTRPATDAWPTYNGDYSGRRFSSLRTINQLNIKQMTLAWIYRAAARLAGQAPRCLR
jgi:alcohol dehydrogenase (cytochrome c)